MYMRRAGGGRQRKRRQQWNSRSDSILKHPSGNYHETSTSDIHDLSVKVVKDECTRTIVGTNPTSVRCRLWKGC